MNAVDTVLTRMRDDTSEHQLREVGCLTIPIDVPSAGQVCVQGRQVLAVELVEHPTKGTVTLSTNGAFTYVPRAGTRGMDCFTYSATDADDGSSHTGRVWLFIGGALRIMPLGDSITMGSYSAVSPLPGRRIGYRKKLYDDLAARANDRYRIEFVGSQQDGQAELLSDARHEGYGGYTTRQIADGVFEWLTANPADIVLLHVGTNDISSDPRATAASIDLVLERIDAWERLNYPIWVFIARIVQRLDGRSVAAFNDDLAARVVARKNTRRIVVDQQTGAGLIYATSGDMADDLHPNQSGYDRIASRWYAELVASGVLPNCGGAIRYSASTRR